MAIRSVTNAPVVQPSPFGRTKNHAKLPFAYAVQGGGFADATTSQGVFRDVALIEVQTRNPVSTLLVRAHASTVIIGTKTHIKSTATPLTTAAGSARTVRSADATSLPASLFAIPTSCITLVVDAAGSWCLLARQGTSSISAANPSIKGVLLPRPYPWSAQRSPSLRKRVVDQPTPTRLNQGANR